MSNNSEQTPRNDTQPGPLSDLRVLELGTLIAGPLAGRWLADFGAEVIKIEHPSQGDPLRKWGMSWDGTDSLWHLVQSRGKQSVAADLHDPEDQAFVRQLAAESDILIENFRPGRLEGWNLDPDDLMQTNPGLIVVRISGYGHAPGTKCPPACLIKVAVSGSKVSNSAIDRSGVTRMSLRPSTCSPAAWLQRGCMYGACASARDGNAEMQIAN